MMCMATCWKVSGLLLVSLVLCPGCGLPSPPVDDSGTSSPAAPADKKDINLAYITNGVASFWTWPRPA